MIVYIVPLMVRKSYRMTPVSTKRVLAQVSDCKNVSRREEFRRMTNAMVVSHTKLRKRKYIKLIQEWRYPRGKQIY